MLLLGYALSASFAASLIGLIAAVVIWRKEFYAVLSRSVNAYSLVTLVVLISFFAAFSLTQVTPTSQLYFDENIYQGIALNILNHFNAVWCQFGTGYVKTCFVNEVYHDPVEGSFFIAIAFGIFGVSLNTAYGLELFEGALFIIAVFLLSSVLLERKDLAVLATAVFAFMPELFIWSRTQADFDLTFGMLAAFAFFFFVVFTKRPSIRTLAPFSFALLMAVFARNEGAMLLGVFAVAYLTFGESGIKRTFGERLRLAIRTIDTNTYALVLLLIFVVLLLPHIYYLSLQFFNPQYGQPSGQGIVSVQDFLNNLGPNTWYFLGKYNSTGYFPAVFPEVITIVAVAGALLFAMDARVKNRFSVLLLLGIWLLAYWTFYTFFYAGSAVYGVDVRFMLQLLPAISIFAGLAMMELANMLSDPKRNVRELFTGAKAIGGPGTSVIMRRSSLIAFILIVAIVVFPFTLLISDITLSPHAMPQQSVIYNAVNFVYNNIDAVPANCLVFTFTPDLFEEFNRSAAQIGYMNGNETVSSNVTGHFSCYVLDYGYWCVVPPNYNTTCKNIVGQYKLQPLASQNSGSQYSPPNVSFYRLLNYT